MKRILPRRKGRRKLSRVKFYWLLPNIFTVMSLSCGLSAIRFAIAERWELAVFMVALGSVLDVLDGRMARLFRTSSNFGAQLDSLSDMVVFGVAPAFLLYLWILQEATPFGWIACLYYSVCCALRLARFNSELHQTPSWASNYFSGIPTPAAALLALTPMAGSFVFADSLSIEIQTPVTIWLVLVGTGAISTFPTFAGKRMIVPESMILLYLGMITLMIAAAIAKPWHAWLGLTSFYLVLLPVSLWRYRTQRQKHTMPSLSDSISLAGSAVRAKRKKSKK